MVINLSEWWEYNFFDWWLGLTTVGASLVVTCPCKYPVDGCIDVSYIVTTYFRCNVERIMNYIIIM